MRQSTDTVFETPADSEEVEFWNRVLVPKFQRFRHILVDGLSRHSAVVFPTLYIRAGWQILDVGCGFGDTAVKLGALTGPLGQVVGVDCCQAFLDEGQKLAAQEGLSNVVFRRADVEAGLPQGQFDFVFARFGTMFFSNPVAALRQLRGALKPGGRLVHIVWRQREDNPWLTLARDVVLRFLPPPDGAGPSCGPGPFSMADMESTRLQMQAAGFADIQFQRVDAPVLIGRTVADAISFQLALGPAGEIFRANGDAAETLRPQIEAALAAELALQEHGAEGIYMNSSSWVISAIPKGSE